MNKSSFSISLTLHMFIFFALLFKGFGGETDGKEGKDNGLDSTINVEIVDRPKAESEEKTVVLDDGLLKRAPHALQECESYFGGVGVTIVWTSLGYIVLTVHSGYPAEKAGIMVGDLLLNSGNLTGEIGTKITVLIDRGGAYLEFPIYRDKICTEAVEDDNGKD